MPTLATAAGVAVALSLAGWQLGRAHEKEALGARLAALARDAPVVIAQAQVRAEDLEWRRVIARGRFEPRYGVLIDNRTRHGVPGYHVVMPLALGGGGRYVLVNRGWIAGNPDRSRLPEVRTPAGEVEVSGFATVPARSHFELSDRVIEGRVWQNLTLERYQRVFPLALQPVLIQQENQANDGLARDWAPPGIGVERHYGYAVQWLLLAVTLLVFYIVTQVERRREPPV
ncbi:MAG: SURF1 family protein [Burkholderiales bacterium]|nr:SURF1 family protein [Burkholderiales bacterium]